MMGTDIHVIAERRRSSGWEVVELPREPFSERSYAVFGFLAGVRNYSGVSPLSDPRGVPDDATAETREFLDWTYGNSWFEINELVNIDPRSVVEDLRYMGMNHLGWMDGGLTAEPGRGEKKTLLEFLGDNFFEDILMCREHDVDRLIFGFDS